MTSTRTAPAAVVNACRLYLGYAASAFVAWTWLIFSIVLTIDHFADLRSDFPAPPPPVGDYVADAGWGALVAVGPTALVVWAAIRMRSGSNVARGALLAMTGIQLPVAGLGSTTLGSHSLGPWEFGAASLLALGFAVAAAIAMFLSAANAYFSTSGLPA